MGYFPHSYSQKGVKMTKKQIKEFLKRLKGPEGCNFHEDTKGERLWRCKAGNDKTYSKKILRSMGISKEEQLTFLSKCESLGGNCDCEIIFNAADHLI